MNSPKLEKKLHKYNIHSTTIEDSYFWLREKDNPKVIEYLKEENSYKDSVLEQTKGLQDDLYKEILSRIKETDLSVPIKEDDYYYYSRTEKGKEYSIYCRKLKSLDAEEEIILDSNELAAGKDYFDLGVLEVSPDHKLLAYSVDSTGAESYTLYIKDLSTGEIVEDPIEDTGPNLEWAEDNKTVFFAILDSAKRPYKLIRHTLHQKDNDEVFHEKDEAFFLGISKTKDKKYLILDLSSKMTSEEYFLDANNPLDDFKIIQKRQFGLEYSAEHHSGHFFILHNQDAKNFKLSKVSSDSPQKENWEDFLPYDSNIKTEDFDVFKNFIVILERHKGLNQFRIVSMDASDEYYMEFDEPVYTIGGGSNPEYNSTNFRFVYSSLTTPSSVFDYDLKTKKRELKKQQEVLGGYVADQYISERIFAISHDGEEIPISLVYKKGLEKNGKNPCYLYGYGSYGISIDPSFSSTRLSLLDRGFVFAIAHIRGGGDLGRPWYDSGKELLKKNTFSDFIACSEHLINKKYTDNSKLIISGGSAGGLLMGAVVNERPDLFQGVIMHVPFVDVVNTMLDSSLPLTITEYEEWGNPNDKNIFDYIRSYSPYDNIKRQDYPHIFVTAGLNDPRVQYWEPAKWVAKLRELKTDKNILILKTNMDAGHGGSSGRYEYLKEVALDYAFMIHILSS